jgi:tRNA-splicing endonuclease subunit Sen34
LAIVHDDVAAHQPASSKEAYDYAEQRARAILQDSASQRRLEDEKRGDIEARFRRQIDNKRAARSARQPDRPPERIDVALGPADSPAPVLRPYTIKIEGASQRAWYSPEKYPLEPSLLLGTPDASTNSRRRVFEDLWKRSYFLGGGLRFGGDYLVYPGKSARWTA